jgi:hypothetical protein
MGKKCLIIYASHSGNTEKVALRIKGTFEKNGWSCDMSRVRKKAEDILRPAFNLDDYDFLCVGSGLINHLPYSEMRLIIRRLQHGWDPRLGLPKGEEITYIEEPIGDTKRGDPAEHHRKITLKPDSKKSAVFVTYSGMEFGPKEAVPSMQLLALDIEHLEFECIGQFCCPGKYLNHPTPRTYHGDIRDRPNEKDLLKAEMFVEEMLEKIAR